MDIPIDDLNEQMNNVKQPPLSSLPSHKNASSIPRGSDVNVGMQSRMSIHSNQQVSGISKSSSKTTLKKPKKPKQFSLKDLAVFSAKIKVKDLMKKDMQSMFKGKYIKIEEEK